jgi:hypothetical protein
MGIAMTNRVSILYTYRNPWPRRLALTAVVLLLLGAIKLATAHLGRDARQQGCTSTAAR